MDVKKKVEILVRQVVEDYLNVKILEESKPVAVLLSYQSRNPEIILDAVGSLMNSYQVTLLVSKDWEPLIVKRKWSCLVMDELSIQKLQAIVSQTSVLVIPASSFQLVSKLALMMDDELSVWLAIQYQLVGKPIVMAKDQVELNVHQQILAPNSVQERLQGYIRQIQADKVKWVPEQQLLRTVEEQWIWYKERKHVILAKHIETAHRDGINQIRVPSNSQVTPSARELAKELNIQITKLVPRKEDS